MYLSQFLNLTENVYLQILEEISLKPVATLLKVNTKIEEELN